MKYNTEGILIIILPHYCLPLSSGHGFNWKYLNDILCMFNVPRYAKCLHTQSRCQQSISSKTNISMIAFSKLLLNYVVGPLRLRH